MNAGEQEALELEIKEHAALIRNNMSKFLLVLWGVR